MTKSSEAYRDTLDPRLYNGLTKAYAIIGEPYVIDDFCDMTLIPVNSRHSGNQLALCHRTGLIQILDIEDIEKIKAFDIAPYKQGSGNGA